MPAQITRRFEFDAGHRVLGHEGKCKNLHGHRYAAEITFQTNSGELDPLGRVLDFGRIKEIVGGWIDANWDHNLLLHPDDPLLSDDLAEAPGESAIPVRKRLLGREPYNMDRYGNPTAENIAESLFYIVQDLLRLSKEPVRVTRVRIYETPNCWADYPR